MYGRTVQRVATTRPATTTAEWASAVAARARALEIPEANLAHETVAYYVAMVEHLSRLEHRLGSAAAESLRLDLPRIPAPQRYEEAARLVHQAGRRLTQDFAGEEHDNAAVAGQLENVISAYNLHSSPLILPIFKTAEFGTSPARPPEEVWAEPVVSTTARTPAVPDLLAASNAAHTSGRLDDLADRLGVPNQQAPHLRPVLIALADTQVAAEQCRAGVSLPLAPGLVYPNAQARLSRASSFLDTASLVLQDGIGNRRVTPPEVLKSLSRAVEFDQIVLIQLSPVPPNPRAKSLEEWRELLERLAPVIPIEVARRPHGIGRTLFPEDGPGRLR